MRHLDIIQKKNYWFALSGVLCGASIILLLIFGLRLGIDFTGGTLIEVQFAQSVTTTDVAGAFGKVQGSVVQQDIPSEPRSVLEVDQDGSGGEVLPEESGTVDLGTPLIQAAEDNRYIVRTKYMNNATHDQVIKELTAINGDTPVKELRYEAIGPTIGATLKKHAILSIVLAALFIILYIAFSFRKVPKSLGSWRFGVTAVIALIHDVLITVGMFSLLGVLLNVEADTLFVTALLTVMGFSVHDTIVVFDRIRENVLNRQDVSFDILANDAINQTLSRSINTSLTTLITLVALFVLGGASIKWFVFALIVGITVGTYSSIFVATPLLVIWRGERATERRKS